MDLIYVGKKDSKIDRFYGTGLIWEGTGDIKTVKDDEVAEKMINECPEIWQPAPKDDNGGSPANSPITALKKEVLADSDGFTAAEKDGEEVPIIQASRAALIAKAKDMGLNPEVFSRTCTRNSLLEAILPVLRAERDMEGQGVAAEAEEE